MSKDLTEKLNGSIEDKIDRLITSVESMDSRLANVETRLANVETRLESLEIKVDERMKETRPIWEALQAQLSELNASQDKGFRRFDHAMDVVSGNQNRLHVDYVELESRVYKIEKRTNE
ncbi:MAG TPA: hypothetical protein VN937_07510 [Blastocatellia bacterium]|nr:hypothetical protein [Blastocatellia bacterium]